MTEKSPAQLAIATEGKLNRLHKRINIALLELDDPKSHRVQLAIKRAKRDKFCAFERQRAKAIGELSKESLAIVKLSSPGLLQGRTDEEIDTMLGLTGAEEDEADTEAPKGERGRKA